MVWAFNVYHVGFSKKKKNSYIIEKKPTIKLKQIN